MSFMPNHAEMTDFNNVCKFNTFILSQSLLPLMFFINYRKYFIISHISPNITSTPSLPIEIVIAEI